MDSNSTTVHSISDQTRSINYMDETTKLSTVSSLKLTPKPSLKPTVLLVGKCAQRETGNATTLYRFGRGIKDGGWNCVILDVDSVPNKSSLCEVIRQYNVISVLGLHAYRCADVLMSCQELSVPYVTVFGGTDVNECVNDEHKKRIMERVVTGAKSLVAFHSSMGDSVLRIWPSLSPDLLWIMPQAIDVYPDPNFDTISYLARIEDNHFGNTTVTTTTASNSPDTNVSKVTKSKESVQMCGIAEDSNCVGNLLSKTKDREDKLKNCVNEIGNRLSKTIELPEEFYPLVILVAGLRPVKDVLYLTEEWSVWHQGRGGRGRFLILGPPIDQEYSDHVETQVRRLSGVRVCPSLSPQECQALVKTATALVNSSCSEGMASSIIEAMALGTPVIVRDIPGNTSLVRDGMNGLVYSRPEEFISQLERLMEDTELRDSVIKAGRTHVVQNHSLKREKELLLKIINSAIK